VFDLGCRGAHVQDEGVPTAIMLDEAVLLHGQPDRTRNVRVSHPNDDASFVSGQLPYDEEQLSSEGGGKDVSSHPEKWDNERSAILVRHVGGPQRAIGPIPADSAVSCGGQAADYLLEVRLALSRGLIG